MDEYIVEKNGKKIGTFITYKNREDPDFPDEFYAMLMPVIPDEDNANLRNKVWSDTDKDFDFEINNNHYSVKQAEEKA